MTTSARMEMETSEEESNRVAPGEQNRLDWGIAIFLFLLALLPRLLGLSAFLTVDEPAWIIRSAHFMQSLMDGNLAGTLQTNHPGVTTVWTGSLGLTAYYFILQPGAIEGSFRDFLAVAGDPYLTPDLLPAVRFPTAALAAVCITAAYFLMRRTFGRKASFLASILVALDPFFITYARVIHHDALVSMFVMVALLAIITYLTSERRLLYAVIAGVATGLAWLSKASSLFLGPLVLLLFGIVYVVSGMRSRSNWKNLLVEDLRGLAAWGLTAGGTFLLLWPALWRIPLAVFQTLFAASADLAESGHLQFFQGEVVTDTGPLFYPVIFLFRSTPITLIGLVLSLLCLIFGYKLARQGPDARAISNKQQAAMGLYWFFIITFAVFITLSPKKQDRYLLPIFPFVDVCAALGFLGALKWLTDQAFEQKKPVYSRFSSVFLGLCLAIMLIVTVYYHPYYISFYNPLAGGAAKAQEEILVGWGEGMDLAGVYLNGKEDAGSLVVSAVPFRTLTPYFEGTATNYLTSNAPALAADYVVTYISQIQRKGPNLRLWQYFQDQEPETIFRLHGIDYARLYPGPRYLTAGPPPNLQSKVNGNFDSKIMLLGYNYESQQGKLNLDLFWQTLNMLSQDYSASIRLLDGEGHRWVQQEGEWVGGLLPTSHCPPEHTVRDERTLLLPAGMPAGSYLLEIYVYSPASEKSLPIVQADNLLPAFGLQAGEIQIPKQKAIKEDIAPQFTANEQVTKAIELIGYDLETLEAQPGSVISPIFYWQASEPISASYSVQLWLEAGTGEVIGQVERDIAGGSFDVPQWQPKDVVRDWQSFPVPPEIPPGSYWLTMRLREAGRDAHTVSPIRLTRIKIEGRPHRFDLPAGIRHESRVNFANRIELLGYDLDAEAIDEQKSLNLTLYWRALSSMTTNYKLFVHVTGPDGQIWGQKDVIPQDGQAPTAGWLDGEVVVESIEIALSQGLPADNFKIVTGWYNETTGQRLQVIDSQGHATDDHATLDESEY